MVAATWQLRHDDVCAPLRDSTSATTSSSPPLRRWSDYAKASRAAKVHADKRLGANGPEHFQQNETRRSYRLTGAAFGDDERNAIDAGAREQKMARAKVAENLVDTLDWPRAIL